jgi:hypothetical protein
VSRQRFWRRRTSSVSTIAIKEKKNCEVTHENEFYSYQFYVIRFSLTRFWFPHWSIIKYAK